MIKYFWKISFSKIPLKTIIFSDNNNTWKSIVQNNNKKVSTLVSRRNPKGQMMNRLWKHFALTLMPSYNMSYRMESEVICLVSFSYNYCLSQIRDRNIRCLWQYNFTYRHHILNYWKKRLLKCFSLLCYCCNSLAMKWIVLLIKVQI